MAYTTEELLEASVSSDHYVKELPCRVCGAPIRIDGAMRMRVLAWRIKWMIDNGATGCTTGHFDHYLDADIAELHTLPGIICGYGGHVNPVPPKLTPTDCEHCGDSFEAQRSTARFCSTRCRVANHRANA